MKIGKGSLFCFLLVAGLSFLLVVSSAYSGKVKPNKAWVGTWRSSVDWSCNGLDWSGIWTLEKNGNFKSNGFAVGTWTGSKTEVTIQYTTGCKPTYKGTMKTKGSAEGKMTCTTGADNGCWVATKSGTDVEGSASDDTPNVP